MSKHDKISAQKRVRFPALLPMMVVPAFAVLTIAIAVASIMRAANSLDLTSPPGAVVCHSSLPRFTRGDF